MTKTRRKLNLNNSEKDVTVQYERHAVTGNGNYVSAETCSEKCQFKAHAITEKGNYVNLLKCTLKKS